MYARSATDINQHYRTLRPQLLMYMVIGYAAFYPDAQKRQLRCQRCKRIWGWIKAISACWGRCFT